MYCCTPKAFYNHVGGGGGWWMMDDATAATGQRRQCVHHTPDTGGLLGGHDWQESVEGIWPGHRGYTLTLYEKCHWIFNDRRESGPRFNVPSERQCLLTVKCPRHTQTTGWAPPAGLTNTSSSSNLVSSGFSHPGTDQLNPAQLQRATSLGLQGDMAAGHIQSHS